MYFTVQKQVSMAAILGAALFIFTGCESSDPEPSNMGGAGGEAGMGGAGGEAGTGGAGGEAGTGGAGGEAGTGGAGGEAGMGGAGGEAGMGGAGGEAGMGGAGGEAGTGGSMACEAAADDYPGDAWDACISDDGTYHLAGESEPSSIARIASFERIAELLWKSDPTEQAFLDARIEYAIDQGLDSRVQRRYDAHLPRPEEGVNCRGEMDGVNYPDYCVGPGKILPLLTQAFAEGAEGNDMVVNAARVEAGLLWFLYVSTYKEAYSCKSAAKDCDSCWAYYGGGETVEGATGFAAYVKAAEPGTHVRIFDAVLAIRCWRHLDNAAEAENAELHARALGQLDRALDRGLMSILIQRVNIFRDSEGDAKSAAWAFLEIMGPTADRAIRASSPESADRLATIWATENGEDVSAEEIIGLINAAHPCP